MTPQLQTERLLLRGWTLEDFETCAHFMADPELGGERVIEFQGSSFWTNVGGVCARLGSRA